MPGPRYKGDRDRDRLLLMRQYCSELLPRDRAVCAALCSTRHVLGNGGTRAHVVVRGAAANQARARVSSSATAAHCSSAAGRRRGPVRQVASSHVSGGRRTAAATAAPGGAPRQTDNLHRVARARPVRLAAPGPVASAQGALATAPRNNDHGGAGHALLVLPFRRHRRLPEQRGCVFHPPWQAGWLP